MTVNKFYPSRKPFKFIKVTLLSFSNARRVITTKLRRVIIQLSRLTGHTLRERTEGCAEEDTEVKGRGVRGYRP